jgi:glycosyltransferase involved in cell wall biosynthesis
VSPPARAPRVASWPHWYGPNPYLPLLYRALAGYGIEHVGHAPLAPSTFSGRDRLADVLHLHWVYPLWREGRWAGLIPGLRIRRGLALLEAIRETGTRLIWTVHNVRPHDGFQRGEQAAYARLHALVDLRVFHSESALEEAQALGGEGRGETLVIPHGNYQGAFPPPTSGAEVRAREGIPDGRRLLLCLGQVREYKGFDVAVQAARALEREDCHLVVAGRPIDHSARRLQELAGGAPNVTLILEELSPQRVADLLGAAAVVLLPYRAITGSGVLLHALTAGRGVVASDLPYFREMLSAEPAAGVLVNAGDPDALARGIRAFLAAPGERAQEAAARLAGVFSWERLAAPLARWIHEAASRRA